MIQRIEEPRPDYMFLKFEGEGSISTMTEKTKNEKIREAVFRIFNLTFENRKRDGSLFQYFETGGIAYLVKRGDEHLITLKGLYWLRERGYIQVKHFLHEMEKIGVKSKLLRMDIRRAYFADRANEPLADLKKGFWIMKSSAESVYYPETINRDFPDSSGALFRSSQFDVNLYNKTRQLGVFEKRIKRLKTEDKKRRLQIAINRHKELYGDKEVFRFELKLKTPESASPFLSDILRKVDEADFCYGVLEAFNASYPMKKGKQESKTYKLFFQRGIYEKKKQRTSRSTKSTPKN